MKKRFYIIPILLVMSLFVYACMLGCGGGGGGDSSSDPVPTDTPISDFYNLVIVQSDESVRCGVTSNNELTGDYEVAPPGERNYEMSPFSFNARVENYFYGIQVNQASGISNHTLYNPAQIRFYRDFSGSDAPENPTGLYTFVNDEEFNTMTNNFEYPNEIRIESPQEGDEIEAGTSFQIKWSSDNGDYRYFVVVEYVEATEEGIIPTAWSSDDFRSLNWADPLSIYSFMTGKTTTDRDIYVPAAIFTTTGAVDITIYGFLPEKFAWDSASDVGYEILAMGKKTVRVNITP